MYALRSGDETLLNAERDLGRLEVSHKLYITGDRRSEHRHLKHLWQRHRKKAFDSEGR